MELVTSESATKGIHGIPDGDCAKTIGKIEKLWRKCKATVASEGRYRGKQRFQPRGVLTPVHDTGDEYASGLPVGMNLQTVKN